MWLRNEVGIGGGQAASFSPAGLGALARVGVGHGPDPSMSPPASGAGQPPKREARPILQAALSLHGSAE